MYLSRHRLAVFGYSYADVIEFINRFNTNDQRDLVGVYSELIGSEIYDPFADSELAVNAFEDAK